MSRNSRRAFLADVGSGMLVAGLGTAAALDLGLATSRAEDEPRDLSFGKLEPLVALLQETRIEKLLPLLVGRLRDGTDLRTLVAAAALANARTFGGEHYQGFHAFMALTPAYQMARELPKDRQPLPVLKVLYRNTHFIQESGGRKGEKLRPIRPADLPKDARRDELLRDSNRRGDKDRSEADLRSDRTTTREGRPGRSSTACRRSRRRPHNGAGMAGVGDPRPDGSGARPHSAPAVGASLHHGERWARICKAASQVHRPAPVGRPEAGNEGGRGRVARTDVRDDSDAPSRIGRSKPSPRHWPRGSRRRTWVRRSRSRRTSSSSARRKTGRPRWAVVFTATRRASMLPTR